MDIKITPVVTNNYGFNLKVETVINKNWDHIPVDEVDFIYLIVKNDEVENLIVGLGDRFDIAKARVSGWDISSPAIKPSDSMDSFEGRMRRYWIEQGEHGKARLEIIPLKGNNRIEEILVRGASYYRDPEPSTSWDGFRRG